jgi:hypothetical protein
MGGALKAAGSEEAEDAAGAEPLADGVPSEHGGGSWDGEPKPGGQATPYLYNLPVAVGRAGSGLLDSGVWTIEPKPRSGFEPMRVLIC